LPRWWGLPCAFVFVFALLIRIPGSCFCASTIFSTENVYSMLTMSVNGVLPLENEGALCIYEQQKKFIVDSCDGVWTVGIAVKP